MADCFRPTVITGNWKMNKTISETRTFVSGLSVAAIYSTAKVGIAVPFTMIVAAAEAARGTVIAVGAQNVSDTIEGAYTGETSAGMVKDAGATFAIVGHSERRRLFHENNELVNRKAKVALDTGLQVIVCIGETPEQHKNGQAKTVVKEQLLKSFSGFTKEQMKQVILAYEPIWAVGTNQTATPEIAQDIHQFCRKVVAEQWGEAVADELVIQYGGSVTPDNAAALLEQPDVDGLLIGGASLSLESFSKIVQYKRLNIT